MILCKVVLHKVWQKAFDANASAMKNGAPRAPCAVRQNSRSACHFKWLLIFLVISNIEICALSTTALSLASALIMVRLTLSCRLFFLMYSQTFLVTSVRGIGVAPMTAAKAALGVMAFMKAALGARFLAGAAVLAGAAAFFAAGAAFLAGAAFFAGAAALAGAFFAGAVLAGAFFAVAILNFSIKW